MKLDQIIESKINDSQTLDELAQILKILIAQHSVWDDGTLLMTRQRVDFVDGFSIEIYSKEHTPPHFHIKSANINASFSIKDCTLLEGNVGGRERRVIEWWFQRSQDKLIKIWNATRPTDNDMELIKGN